MTSICDFITFHWMTLEYYFLTNYYYFFFKMLRERKKYIINQNLIYLGYLNHKTSINSVFI